MRDVEELVDLFRLRGLRITPQRRQIFRVLVGNGSHPTAEAVWNEVRKEQPAISLKTVYETLRELVEIGAIQQMHLEPGASRFDPNASAHHHLVCRACGRMVDVESAAGDTMRLTASRYSGYEIDEAEVIFWGRCSDCVAASPADAKRTQRARPVGETAPDRGRARSRP